MKIQALYTSYESPTHISIIFSLRYEIGQKNVDRKIFKITIPKWGGGGGGGCQQEIFSYSISQKENSLPAKKYLRILATGQAVRHFQKDKRHFETNLDKQILYMMPIMAFKSFKVQRYKNTSCYSGLLSPSKFILSII